MSIAKEVTSRCRECGAAVRRDDSTCVKCFLEEGLQAPEDDSAQVFESVLREVDLPDQPWRLGNYEILEEIGRGGMGVIYRARQRHSRRIVAVKRLLAQDGGSAETRARFRREAQAVARLDHPNILPIYEVSESEEGVPYFSMKFASGGSLRTAACSFSDPRDAVRLMEKIARAIAFAHGQGILHRDLQPGNILLDGHGEPLVSDFGLAKWLRESSDLTQTLTTLGTPGFIAPEQAEGAELSPAADIYSLGAILFHLLAKRPPFLGTNALSVIRQAAASSAPKLRSLAPRIDRDLETICGHALERDPKARYQSAAHFADDLRRWVEHRPISARPVRAPIRLWRWARRNPLLASATILCCLFAATIAFLLQAPRPDLANFPAPAKSVAVLPFENLGEDKQESDFATGMQNDLLTNLTQIHDLKVIRRASVLSYRRRDGRDLRAIGRTLGVANVLEGSVRRAGDRVLVDVQLIDTRSEHQVWAKRYDRTIKDAIGLQGELATEIAAALKTTLAPAEMAHFAAKPTIDSEAYSLYLTAFGREETMRQWPEDAIAAEAIYVQATALDPRFALAYARASLLNSQISSHHQDPGRNRKARAQAEEALRLSPSLGEGHMARGLCLYWGEKDYDAALKEFELAATASPNNAEIYNYVGGIYRRQGRWREAVASFDRAFSLDPRNAEMAKLAANHHYFMREWSAAAASYTRALEIEPDSVWARVGLAYLQVIGSANVASARGIVGEIPIERSSAGGVLARWDFAMLARDYPAAEKIASDLPEERLQKNADCPKALYQGATARARGDFESARHYFALATPVLENSVRDNPDEAECHAKLGLLYAYMQRKEDAIREGQRAAELEPESRDAFHGAGYQANLSLIYALTGEPDRAIALIERLLSIPGAVAWSDCPSSISLAELRLRWEWDGLRNNPRFQKILEGPEPKTIF